MDPGGAGAAGFAPREGVDAGTFLNTTPGGFAVNGPVDTGAPGFFIIGAEGFLMTIPPGFEAAG